MTVLTVSKTRSGVMVRDESGRELVKLEPQETFVRTSVLLERAKHLLPLFEYEGEPFTVYASPAILTAVPPIAPELYERLHLFASDLTNLGVEPPSAVECRDDGVFVEASGAASFKSGAVRATRSRVEGLPPREALELLRTLHLLAKRREPFWVTVRNGHFTALGTPATTRNISEATFALRRFRR